MNQHEKGAARLVILVDGGRLIEGAADAAYAKALAVFEGSPGAEEISVDLGELTDPVGAVAKVRRLDCVAPDPHIGQHVRRKDDGRTGIVRYIAVEGAKRTRPEHMFMMAGDVEVRTNETSSIVTHGSKFWETWEPLRLLVADLTEDDLSTMARALDLEVRFEAGIFPRGGAQHSHFKRLCRIGALYCTGEFGRDIDLEVDDDVLLYRLTPEGRAHAEDIEAKAKAAFEENCAHHEAIDWALEQWRSADSGRVVFPEQQATPKQLAALHRLNTPGELATLLREEAKRRGVDAREPSEKQPGPDGNFVTIGPIDGTEGPLIEIDRPEQCESFTMAQARKLFADLRSGKGVDFLIDQFVTTAAVAKKLRDQAAMTRASEWRWPWPLDSVTFDEDGPVLLVFVKFTPDIDVGGAKAGKLSKIGARFHETITKRWCHLAAEHGDKAWHLALAEVQATLLDVVRREANGAGNSALAAQAADSIHAIKTQAIQETGLGA